MRCSGAAVLGPSLSDANLAIIMSSESLSLGWERTTIPRTGDCANYVQSFNSLEIQYTKDHVV